MSLMTLLASQTDLLGIRDRTQTGMGQPGLSLLPFQNGEVLCVRFDEKSRPVPLPFKPEGIRIGFAIERSRLDEKSSILKVSSLLIRCVSFQIPLMMRDTQFCQRSFREKLSGPWIGRSDVPLVSQVCKEHLWKEVEWGQSLWCIAGDEDHFPKSFLSFPRSVLVVHFRPRFPSQRLIRRKKI